MPRKDLFELCEICGGKGVLPDDARTCVAPPDALSRMTRRADGKIVCPSCGGKQFVAIGLSAGQVEMIIRERDELKQRVAELEGRR